MHSYREGEAETGESNAGVCSGAETTPKVAVDLHASQGTCTPTHTCTRPYTHHTCTHTHTRTHTFNLFLFLYVYGVLPACLSVYVFACPMPQMLGDCARYSRTGVTDSHEPPYGFWESKPGLLEEQQGTLNS